MKVYLQDACRRSLYKGLLLNSLFVSLGDFYPFAVDECPVAVYRAQHSAGCWSCLVLEKITSAFLNTAQHGMPITQKAGVFLLCFGSILWLLKWGLDNVSSFSVIQLANILNTLFKFSFKVLLAYWFIVLSSTAISQYFIRPIMSVGAIIGQNMWGDEVKDYVEVWDDLADVDITEEVKKAEEEKIILLGSEKETFDLVGDLTELFR